MAMVVVGGDLFTEIIHKPKCLPITHKMIWQSSALLNEVMTGSDLFDKLWFNCSLEIWHISMVNLVVFSV